MRILNQPTDEELIRDTLAGNQGAFAELIRRHQRRVAVTIRSIVGAVSQEDLADIAQDIFLLVYRGLPSFRGESQFGTYITRIAIRHCYRVAKRLRKRKMLFRSTGSESEHDGSPSIEMADRSAGADRPLALEERREAVLEAMNRLPEEFRTILVLRIVEEMPVEEVAESLGISVGTVKSRLFRAKEKMRELLAGQDVEFQLDAG